jgi:CelD/BcsL family acetyltransferase involved in cellulose biosynthesis
VTTSLSRPRTAAPSAQISVARTIAEVEALRPEWVEQRWERVDADIDFYLAVLASRPEVVRPHVLVHSGDDGPESMVVGRIEDVELKSSIGYRVVARPRVRSLTVVPRGIAGADTPQAARRLLAALTSTLARGEADVVVLPGLPTDSPLYEAARREPRLLCRDHLVEPGVHHRLRLPGSFDELLATRSRSTREAVKRYSKRLLRDHGDRISIEVFSRPEESERLFRDLEAVAAKTYQRGLGVAFADTEGQRALVRLGLERGWFRAWALYLAGAPIAFWSGYAYNGTFFIGTPGYDPSYADYRVGQFLQMRMLEDLCVDEGVEALDYGPGEAEYKRRFGNESWEEADVLVFSPSTRAVRINVVRTAVNGATRLARRVLGGERADLIKKRWRARLARKESSATR